MFYKFNDSEIRSICKEKLESLEYWLRRTLDDTLHANYGDYFEFKDEKGNRLIKTQTVDSLKSRKNAEPDRYPRLIDTILLDDAIDIICNPNLYNKHFSSIFKVAFPEGRDEARTFMKRLISGRNALAHANPISHSQAERIVCYSNDIIDSIKIYYIDKNMGNEYNVPLILKVIDSFGNVFHRNQMNPVHDGGVMKTFFSEPKFNLHVGDILTIEVEVDPSYCEDEYTITWGSGKGFSTPIPNGKKAIINITEKQVTQQFDVQCRVISNKGWHRMSLGADDFLLFYYKVLPPN